MAASALSEIESQFPQLPTEAQLNILEHLVHPRAGWFGWQSGHVGSRSLHDGRRSRNAKGTQPHQLGTQPCRGRRLGESLMPVESDDIYLVNLNPVQGREQAGCVQEFRRRSADSLVRVFP